MRSTLYFQMSIATRRILSGTSFLNKYSHKKGALLSMSIAIRRMLNGVLFPNKYSHEKDALFLNENNREYQKISTTKKVNLWDP